MTAFLGRALVLTIVGTDVHPFDRLVRWVDEWEHDVAAVRVFQQIGHSTPPALSEYARLLPIDELHTLIRSAVVVVTHGGPAAVAEVRRLGRHPLVVPRDPQFGEHVDSHQLRYAAHLGGTARARIVQHRNELHHQLDVAISNPELFRCVPDTGSVAAATEAFSRLVGSIAPSHR